MRWTHTPLPAAEVEALSKRAGVSRVLAELLLRAGLGDGEAAAAFLQPALAGLNDPFLLRNLEAARDAGCARRSRNANRSSCSAITMSTASAAPRCS